MPAVFMEICALPFRVHISMLIAVLFARSLFFFWFCWKTDSISDHTVQLQIRSKMNTHGGFRRKLWHAEEEACLVTKVSLSAIGATIGNDPDTCQRSECTNNNGGPVIKCTTRFCLFPWGHCHAIYRFSLVLSGFEWFCVGGMTLVFSGFALVLSGFALI